MAKLQQTSFARGEISPGLYGRTDTTQYEIALRTAKNVSIHQFGGASNRTGTVMVGPVKTHTQAPRLIDFQFKNTDTHMLEFGDTYIRFIRNDAHITETDITGVTASATNPVVLTKTSHGYSDGDDIYLSGFTEMTELNGRRCIVANKAANTLELTDQITGDNIDGLTWTTETTGGTMAKVYEIVSPYSFADLDEIKFVQTADVVTLTHPSYPPYELSRLALASWTMTEMDVNPSQIFPTTLAVSGGTGSDVNYVVTAQDDEGVESLRGVDSANAKTITGITAADPAVVTSASHGLTNGDLVYIEAVVGMTEVNDRQFIISNTDTNTFELLNVNSTSYTAYSSAGTAKPAFVASANDTDVTITWAAAANAVKYNIYKVSEGLFGYLASTSDLTYTDDASVTPDVGDGPPVWINPFVGTDNYPAAVGFHQQRRTFGGTNNNPDKSWFSVIGSFNDFSTRENVTADDGFNTTLASGQINAIRHYTSRDALLTFTSGQEWVFRGTESSRFSIDTIDQSPQTNWGCSQIRPLLVGNTVLFINSTANAVRTMEYSFEHDHYIASDVSLMVPHLFRNRTIVDWAHVRTPDPVIYFVRSDGVLLQLTFNEEQEILAWSTWETEGNFERVSVIRPSISDVHEQAYFVVKRVINGNTVRFIEKTHDREFDVIEDAFFVDAGLSLDTPITITGVTAANPPVVTATSHGLSDGDIIDCTDVVWVADTDSVGNVTQPDQLNGWRFIIANKTANTFELTSIEDGTNIDGSAYNAYVEGGVCRKAVLSVSGLFHLAGHAVQALCDGNVVKSLTVDSEGTLTFTRRFSRIHVGLPYTADIELLDLEKVSQTGGTVQGRKIKIPYVTLRFDRTVGGWVGPNSTDLVEIKTREFELMGQPDTLYTGDYRQTLMPHWDSKGRLLIRQKDPLPMTLLMAVPDIEVGDQ